MRKILSVVMVIMALVTAAAGCDKTDRDAKKTEASKSVTTDVYEKGYDLPIEDKELREAESDSNAVMNKIRDTYKNADKGQATNVVVDRDTIKKMMDILKDTGAPVYVSGIQMNMCNSEKMEEFIEKALDEKEAELVTYEIHDDGTVGRRKFSFDGRDMYALDTKTSWNGESPVIASTSYSRMQGWRYTEKGWFVFEYCVPEPPEVTEIVSAYDMVRVKPLKEEYLEIMNKYLVWFGYQGNNLLSEEWDTEHMEILEYNKLFDYLYVMKYGEKPEEEQYRGGIPKDEFESLMTEYLPVTAEQLGRYALFDPESQTYDWRRLGTLNYAPNVIGTSVPEIVGVTENEDHTVTLSLDAVCEIAGQDKVMSHQLTVRFTEDGGIKYLGNQKILKYSE